MFVFCRFRLLVQAKKRSSDGRHVVLIDRKQQNIASEGRRNMFGWLDLVAEGDVPLVDLASEEELRQAGLGT